MKNLILLVILSLNQVGQAQLDSSVVKPFFDKGKFPNVIEVYYESNTRFNGKVKSEGWIIEEMAGINSTILVIEGSSEDQIMIHKIGVWKYYDSKGNMEAVDSIQYLNGMRFGSQSHFYKNGTVKYRYILTSKDKISELKGIDREGDLNNKLFSCTELYEYDKNGNLTRKRIWQGEKLLFDEKYRKLTLTK